MDKNTRTQLRCEKCGRFVGWDGYYARWHCRQCELSVSRTKLDRLIAR